MNDVVCQEPAELNADVPEDLAGGEPDHVGVVVEGVEADRALDRMMRERHEHHASIDLEHRRELIGEERILDEHGGSKITSLAKVRLVGFDEESQIFGDGPPQHEAGAPQEEIE